MSSSAASGAESSSEDEILDAVAIASFAARVAAGSRFYTSPARAEAGLGAKYPSKKLSLFFYILFVRI